MDHVTAISLDQVLQFGFEVRFGYWFGPHDAAKENREVLKLCR